MRYVVFVSFIYTKLHIFIKFEVKLKTMQEPLEFYKKEKQHFESELQTIKKKLTLSSIFRLVVFSIIIFGVYLFFGNNQAISIIIIVGILVFLFLVSKHTNLLHKKEKLLALININNTEINVLNNNKSDLDFGEQYKNPQHEYSYDIDLFGKGSFFQYINRTSIKSGKDKLVKIFTCNSITNIDEKQKAIIELAKKSQWRQNFSAIASLVKVETKETIIITWLKKHQIFLPKIAKYLPLLFFGISVSLFTLFFLHYIRVTYIVIWFFIGLGVSGIYLKKINTLYHNATKAKDTFKQYYQLLLQIENEKLNSEVLKNKQEEIKTDNLTASTIFNTFSKALDSLDQRNNILFGILGNAFALWDIKQSYKIEQWIKNYHHQVKNWFEVIAFFDAQNSLANYVFNHPKHSFPILKDNNFTIKALQLGHPLLDKNKRIYNDFIINDKEFFIITGANMAGKSTFLRTVSLSIVMANIGLPVCAKKFEYKPIRLITSMRTSDSLNDDESYFFSELKRLKFIVDAINPEKATKQYFIILDEILKGTNSKDKAIGSRKFIEKLVKFNSTGIIATHDLSLCEITNKLIQIKNYYFDAEIINDELSFDYIFKQGVCQNMNASFLLKKMKII